MNKLKSANRRLKLFSWFKIPLIGICNPKITELSADKIVVRIPLNLFTKNHLGRNIAMKMAVSDVRMSSHTGNQGILVVYGYEYIIRTKGQVK